MKKQLIIFGLLLLVATSGFAQFTLRATVPASTMMCYTSGGFNGWKPLINTPMTLVSTDAVAGTKVFSVNLPLTFVNSGGFQIIAGTDWSFAQSDSQFGAITTVGATSQDVVVTSFKALPVFIDASVTVPVAVNECYIIGGSWGWTLPYAGRKMTLVSTTATNKVFKYSIDDKTATHNIAVKFLAGLDGTNWTYQQTAAANFVYAGTDATCSFVCDAFNSIYVPVATAVENTINDGNSIKVIDKSIVAEGVVSNVSVFDVRGNLIQSVNTKGMFTSKTLNSGLYIIRVDNKTYKQVIN